MCFLFLERNQTKALLSLEKSPRDKSNNRVGGVHDVICFVFLFGRILEPGSGGMLLALCWIRTDGRGGAGKNTELSPEIRNVNLSSRLNSLFGSKHQHRECFFL